MADCVHGDGNSSCTVFSLLRFSAAPLVFVIVVCSRLIFFLARVLMSFPSPDVLGLREEMRALLHMH